MAKIVHIYQFSLLFCEVLEVKLTMVRNTRYSRNNSCHKININCNDENSWWWLCGHRKPAEKCSLLSITWHGIAFLVARARSTLKFGPTPRKSCSHAGHYFLRAISPTFRRQPLPHTFSLKFYPSPVLSSHLANRMCNN